MTNAHPGLLRKGPYVERDRVFEVLDAMEISIGMQASTHVKFRSTVVARDSVEMALDILPYQPARVRRIIHSLARHIGLRTDLVTEEEEGKIMHEHASLRTHDVVSTPEVQEVVRFLSGRWGGSEDEFTYFGSMDATGLYLVLLDEYVRRNGDGILEEEFVHHRTGQSFRIYETVVMAAEFYMAKIADSPLGLLEYVRLNKENGFWFQVARESPDTLLLPDGTLPNIDSKLAFLELQTLARRALRAAAHLVRDRKLHERWRAQADLLLEETLRRFWSDEAQRFGRAIHRDQNGDPELLFMNDSVPAEILRDDPFAGLSEAESQKYVSSIVRNLYSGLLTDAGFRMQGLEYENFTHYWSYAGPHVVFPIATKRIAEGLHKYGLTELGVDADRRLIDACNLVQGFPDVHFVDDDGRIVLIADGDEVPSAMEVVNATTKPMMHHGWTAAAALTALERKATVRARSKWKAELVDEVNDGLWQQYSNELHIDLTKAEAQPPKRWLDQESGVEKEEAFVRRSGRARNSAILPFRPRRGGNGEPS